MSALTRGPSPKASLATNRSQRRQIWFFLSLAFLICLVPQGAFAQARPELRATIERGVVEVGALVHLSLSAMSSEAMPQNPEPGATPGFKVRGASASPSQSISIVNGVRTDRQGITATWTLQAQKVGSYSVGPVSVVVAGKKYETNRVTVRVVPVGQSPPDDSQVGGGIFGPGFSPFDPWKGLLQPFSNDSEIDRPEREGPATDPRFALDAPRGDVAFLHAVVDKPRAVVGEQVTLTIYLYVDERAPSSDGQDVHEAVVGDFLKKPLLEDERKQKVVGIAEVSGRRYMVVLIRKVALFPLKAGDLEIGPMTRSVVVGRNAVMRESERLNVRVTEPPVAGRPPGYTVGDVGRFALSAEVSPRAVERGAAVAVNVELKGTGNLPSALVPPVRAGVEWLDPDVHEKLGAADGQRFGGQRSFSFVVQMKAEGNVDLGSFVLPYWDPDTKAYAVARADLGRVVVRPGAAPAVARDEKVDPLPGLPSPRGRLEGVRSVTSHLSDSPVFWIGLAAPPFAYAFALGAHAAGRRMRTSARRRATSPVAALKARIAEAESASKERDPRAAYAAIVRAVEAATFAYAGVNVRGIAVDDVARALEGRGVDGATAHALRDTLDACGNARFSPEAHDIEAARTRWVETQRAFAALARAPRGSV
jgi:hypothetical protein